MRKMIKKMFVLKGFSLVHYYEMPGLTLWICWNYGDFLVRLHDVRSSQYGSTAYLDRSILAGATTSVELRSAMSIMSVDTTLLRYMHPLTIDLTEMESYSPC